MGSIFVNRYKQGFKIIILQHNNECNQLFVGFLYRKGTTLPSDAKKKKEKVKEPGELVLTSMSVEVEAEALENVQQQWRDFLAKIDEAESDVIKSGTLSSFENFVNRHKH